MFTDLCGWANNYLDLWTAQIYETRDQYCKPGGSHCIQLSIQYLCEEPSDNTGLVTYEGCMVSESLLQVGPLWLTVFQDVFRVRHRP